jgi:TetR/AcrR family transcriptional repressor of nem operon
MRYAAGHKERTRARILESAARAFRERGYAAAGVDGVMKEAGLTAGGFYAHFRSKEALLAETLAAEAARTRDLLFAGTEGAEGIAPLAEAVRRYLSRAHRDAVDAGCIMPPLVSELPRASPAAREVFDEHLRRLAAEVEAHAPAAPGLEPRDRALATIALCLGGLALSRAVADRALSDRILAACRRLAVPEVTR